MKASWGQQKTKDCLVCEHQQIAHGPDKCWVCECTVPWGGQHGVKPEVSDPDWASHDGYPRDMTEVEEAQRAVKKQAEQMASSVISFGGLGNIRHTVFESDGMVAVGDPIALRGKNGKVVKAGLGETWVGTVTNVDTATGLVTVRMR